MTTEIKPAPVMTPAVKAFDSKACGAHTRTFTEPLSMGEHTFKCEACGDDFVVAVSQQFPPPLAPLPAAEVQAPLTPPKPS